MASTLSGCTGESSGEPDDVLSGASGLAQRKERAPLVAVGVATAVIASFYVLAVLAVSALELPVWRTVEAVALLTCVAALQLLHSSRTTHPLIKQLVPWTLLLQAALIAVGFLEFHTAWSGVPGFLCGSLLLQLRWPLAWSLTAAVVAALDVAEILLGLPVLEIVYVSLSTLITGLVLFGLAWLGQLVHEVHAAQRELAHVAVLKERLRFARDLHDLLGYSLSSITLKSELAHRLLPSEPEQTHRELREILQISREALADVRAVASGYRAMSLSREMAMVESMLSAAGIRSDFTWEITTQLSGETDTVLATVLREGITNMLRHSTAETCTAKAVQTAGAVRLTLVNDGVTRQAQPDPLGGSGLGNLSARVAALGGTLSAAMGEGGRFLLEAEVPLHGAGGKTEPARPWAPESEPAGFPGDPDGINPVPRL
ncbi:hypothetical protein GJU35_29415 [Streptomyces lincolnensis]|nr:hypothetical protein GJU35_29415 [Streptomyces lincolnensis]